MRKINFFFILILTVAIIIVLLYPKKTHLPPKLEREAPPPITEPEEIFLPPQAPEAEVSREESPAPTQQPEPETPTSEDLFDSDLENLSETTKIEEEGEALEKPQEK